MRIFSSILAKVFPGTHPSVTTPNVAPTSTAAPGPALPSVDVQQILRERAEGQAERLNWRTSIVDLMKLLDLDSSLGACKELATELRYTGDMNDVAAMNVWLHRQVMAKLAHNGGHPTDLQ